MTLQILPLAVLFRISEQDTCDHSRNLVFRNDGQQPLKIAFSISRGSRFQLDFPTSSLIDADGTGGWTYLTLSSATHVKVCNLEPLTHCTRLALSRLCFNMIFRTQTEISEHQQTNRGSLY